MSEVSYKLIMEAKIFIEYRDAKRTSRLQIPIFYSSWWLQGLVFPVQLDTWRPQIAVPRWGWIAGNWLDLHPFVSKTDTCRFSAITLRAMKPIFFFFLKIKSETNREMEKHHSWMTLMLIFVQLIVVCEISLPVNNQYLLKWGSHESSSPSHPVD